jgi:hypothetical protein
MFQAGRFTSSDGRSCTFAVANDSLREQCERKRAEVEAAIAEHFGSRLSMRLVVDEPGSAGARAPAPPSEPPASPSPAHDLDELDDLDLDGGEVADSTSIATARVLDAFPGATEVRA